VVSLSSRDTYRMIGLEDGSTLAATAVIVASGVAYRTLDVAGAEALVGSGIFYGASVHEARTYEGEDVVIVGGANSAGQAALHLARFARRVTLLVRSEKLDGMSAYLVDQVEQTPSIDVRLGTRLQSVDGDGHLEHVEVVDAAGASTASPPPACSCSSGPAPSPTGSRAWLPATPTASCSSVPT
jgi:thioredoxin reductase (NADPH)